MTHNYTVSGSILEFLTVAGKIFTDYSKTLTVAAESFGPRLRSGSQKQCSMIALGGLIKTAGHLWVNGSFVPDCFQLCLIVF